MHVARKALRNFRYMLNKEFLQKGKTPFVKYNMVEHEDWEVFATQRQTPEAQAKSKEFTALAKRNEHPHHMGMIGYPGHKPRWRAEERARVEAGEPDPYEGLDERAKDFLKGRKPKKLKEGKKKFNEPKIKEAEKAIVAVTKAKESGSFQPRRGMDVLTAALGNLSTAAQSVACP
jgi:hypothetical protein